MNTAPSTASAAVLKRTLGLAAAGPALLLLGACASGPNEGGAVARAGGGFGAECIPNSAGIRDFETLDDQNLILYGPGNRPYHVILSTPSLDIESEFRIGVVDPDGRLCPYAGDAIVIDGPLTETIRISSIQRLDDADLEALRVEFGKTEAATETDVVVTEIQ